MNNLLQSELEAHFAGLAKGREARRAVFALEHGLDGEALERVRNEIRGSAASQRLRDEKWLLWTVHAAEVAYSYSGGEYWQSFAEHTPGWDDRDRQWIRGIFERFQERFRGPLPNGRWAEWFTIICWPITNSVLPTDLQRHLARVLYELRGGLALHLKDSDDLGHFIAQRSSQASGRFESLMTQPELLGQISLALLRPGAGADEYLLPATTTRIVADLQKHRESRFWLGQAKAAVDHEIRVQGVRSKGTVARPESPSGVSLVPRVRAASPRLFLARMAGGSWAPRLRLPYLGGFGDQVSEVRTALESSRAWIPSAAAPIARGRLLYDRQEVPLVRWPKPREQLLKFGEPASGLETALMGHWLAPSEPWLFKAQVNGKAELLDVLSVRPSETYILASNSPLQSQLLTPTTSACPGASLYTLSLPSHSSRAMLEELRRLGIGASFGIAVSPVGVPAGWDGQGRSQWIVGETPSFALAPDHSASRVDVSVGEGDRVSLELSADSTGFVAIQGLPAGTHEMLVTEYFKGAPHAKARFTIEMRDPRPVVPEHAGPLVGWVEPHSTRLDDLWTGRSTISVVGTSREARCRLSLAARANAPALAEAETSVTLPLTGQAWRSTFGDFLQRAKGVEQAFDSSRWAQVVISAGEFGRCAFEFERDVPPIRWRLATVDRQTRLSLVDETDSELTVTAHSAPYTDPMLTRPVSFKKGAARDASLSLIDPLPGLYLAESGRHRASILVPPPTVFRSFSDMELGAIALRKPRSPAELATLAERLNQWAAAATSGTWIAGRWRAQVVNELHRTFVETICGRAWADAEKATVIDKTHKTPARLANILLTAATLPAAGVRLIDASTRISAMPVAERLAQFQSLSTMADRYAPKSMSNSGRPSTWQRWLAEFALRTAYSTSFGPWAGRTLVWGIEALVEWPVLLEVARYWAVQQGVGLHDDLHGAAGIDQ